MSDDRFKVSWSSLQRFELCKQKQYLYSQRVSTPDQNVRNFLAGNIVDRIQRDWLDNPVAGVMHTWVDDYMERCVAEAEESGRIEWRSKNDKREIRNFCVEVVKDLEPILTARVLPYDYEPAKRFYTPVKIRNPEGETVEIVLRGEFDLLIRDPADGRFEVWDLKTTKDNDYWKKTLGQLVFYDLAIISLFGQPPKRTGLIQPACDEQIKEFTFTNEDRSQMWGRITAMVQADWAGDHSPKADPAGCSWCEYARACIKFNKPLTIQKVS